MEQLAASCWEILLELAPWLLLGTLVAGVLHVALPRRLVRGALQGRWGVVKAVLVGVPMPLCSCGVIPAGLGLRREGASRGASIGFMISTPETGVDSILVSASFLGWPFALFKVAAAAVLGVVGGWWADLVPEGGDARLRTDGGDDDSGPRRPWPIELCRYGLELLQTIWGWLVVGVVISALIDVLVPERVLAGLGALGPLGAGLVALAVSLPLYVCATASVPIAAALVAGGMPAGAALVFLMAGPATNVATLGAVLRGFGARVLGVYLTVLVVGSLLAGVLFERLIPAQEALRQGHEHGVSWWAVAAAMLLLALLARFAFEDALRLARRWRGSRSGSGSPPGRHLAVTGMTCDGCARRVEGALLAVPGVVRADVDRPAGLVTVSGSASLVDLEQALATAGYPVAELAPSTAAELASTSSP
ncbi:MAG: hypothetical protein DWQ36_07895 [Acidobacteria bacterium]|nr:MAG: hypothetical protein DWQ30_03930 [Acidobacteriota bacterium]REK08923.1 MAG: hypothetical protein DWQ36_07895 [Acidobacteriota bacterium]